MSTRNYQKQNGKVLNVSLKLACIKFYWFNMTCLNLTALKEWELTTTETKKTHNGQTFFYSNSDSKPDRRNNNHWVKGIASEPVKTFIHYMHKASNERGIGGRKVRPEFLLLPPWPPINFSGRHYVFRTSILKFQVLGFGLKMCSSRDLPYTQPFDRL